MSKKTYTITAALPYANGPIHIGHLAGVYIPADIYARYLRSQGEEVVFICGSDEHGVPITIKAEQEGISPQDVVDRYHALNKESFQQLGISFDIFSRTSSAIHHEMASDFFVDLYEKNVFETHESEQFYDPVRNQFLADRYIKGTCPKCEFEDAYGDQCEKCGSTLSPEELLNPRSALSGALPEKRKTKHWYLPLNKFESWLKQWILKEHRDWKNNVYGQCKSWLDQGLRPRAVTRDLDWGVPVPLPDAKGKVLYVWFDAPIGYISATKEWAEQHGKDWKKYWQDPDTRLVHFVGKDNIVFHCIIFPAMLKAHGDYILPANVPANEFMNLEGRKLSTSKNWAVWLHKYLKDFPGQQDVLRYVICANAPETKDSDFTWKDFYARNNNELVAILGNFVNRTMVLTHKYFEGKVPDRQELSSVDEELINELKVLVIEIGASIEAYKLREALDKWLQLARLGNKYLAETEPWKIKDNTERVGTILNICLQVIVQISITGEPFLPFTAKKLQQMLKIVRVTWQDAGNMDLLISGNIINSPELLFEKMDNNK